MPLVQYLDGLLGLLSDHAGHSERCGGVLHCLLELAQLCEIRGDRLGRRGAVQGPVELGQSLGHRLLGRDGLLVFANRGLMRRLRLQ